MFASAVVLFVCRVSFLAALRYATLSVFPVRTGCCIHVVFVLVLTFFLYCISVLTGFPNVIFRCVCCMLVSVILSYVLVRIRADYLRCVVRTQIWGHYSLYILYVLCSVCEDLSSMFVQRMNVYMFDILIHRCHCIGCCLTVLCCSLGSCLFLYLICMLSECWYF